MEQKPSLDSEERGIQIIKKVLIRFGVIFSLVGLIRQWPILGKTYLEFIEGKGYMPFILGLIMILLGVSVRLLVGEPESS